MIRTFIIYFITLILYKISNFIYIDKNYKENKCITYYDNNIYCKNKFNEKTNFLIFFYND